jgi:hypothetical protein
MMPCSVSVCAVVVEGAGVVVLSLPQPVLSTANASRTRAGHVKKV